MTSILVCISNVKCGSSLLLQKRKKKKKGSKFNLYVNISGEKFLIVTGIFYLYEECGLSVKVLTNYRLFQKEHATGELFFFVFCFFTNCNFESIVRLYWDSDRT